MAIILQQKSADTFSPATVQDVPAKQMLDSGDATNTASMTAAESTNTTDSLLPVRPDGPNRTDDNNATVRGASLTWEMERCMIIVCCQPPQICCISCARRPSCTGDFTHQSILSIGRLSGHACGMATHASHTNLAIILCWCCPCLFNYVQQTRRHMLASITKQAGVAELRHPMQPQVSCSC